MSKKVKRPCTWEIVQAAMAAVAKDVIKPKCVRTGKCKVD